MVSPLNPGKTTGAGATATDKSRVIVLAVEMSALPILEKRGEATEKMAVLAALMSQPFNPI